MDYEIYLWYINNYVMKRGAELTHEVFQTAPEGSDVHELIATEIILDFLVWVRTKGFEVIDD